MKIFAVRAELLHADGQTDRQTDRHVKKLIVVFRSFANARKYCCCIKEDRVSNMKVFYFCKGKCSRLIVKPFKSVWVKCSSLGVKVVVPAFTALLLRVIQCVPLATEPGISLKQKR